MENSCNRETAIVFFNNYPVTNQDPQNQYNIIMRMTEIKKLNELMTFCINNNNGNEN